MPSSSYILPICCWSDPLVQLNCSTLLQILYVPKCLIYRQYCHTLGQATVVCAGNAGCSAAWSPFLCGAFVVLFEMRSHVSVWTHNCTQPSNPAHSGFGFTDQSTKDPPHELSGSICTWKYPSNVVVCNCIWTNGIHSVVAATLYGIISYRSTQELSGG